MSPVDYIVLALVVLALLGAGLLWRKSRKKGSCGGDCAHCHHSC